MSRRNIVICLDGTANEPEKSESNVLRTYKLVERSDEQILYYDPGVGTLGARSRSTRIGKSISRIGGLALGHGVLENIEESYRFLMDTYEPGDRIYIFGFSRGAYTARALAGLIRCVGLIRPECANMVPYGLKLFTRRASTHPGTPEYDEYWRKFNEFGATFGNPAFPSSFDRSTAQIHFLGLWDTVKFVGWLNFKGQLQQARWPFTPQHRECAYRASRACT